MEMCILLEYAVHHACETIFQKAQQEPEKRGMGTTVVVLLVVGGRGFIAYVGDSRIYLLRGGIVYQLTEDHSIMNELIRQGKITAEEFDDSPYAQFKHRMTRAVGVYAEVEVDTLDFELVPGDAFLLCSDGLYDYLTDEDLAASLALPNVEEIPGRLIELANTRGGKDNISAVVVRIPEDEHDGPRAAELNLTLDTLKKIPLFRQLTYQQLVRIMNLMRQVPLAPGLTLCHQGEVGDQLFVIVQGEVELTRDGQPITTLGAGSHVGEMALVDSAPRSVTAQAITAGRALVMTRMDFYEILRKEAPLAVKLLWSFVKELAERLRATNASLSAARQAAGMEDLSEALAADEEPDAAPGAGDDAITGSHAKVDAPIAADDDDDPFAR